MQTALVVPQTFGEVFHALTLVASPLTFIGCWLGTNNRSLSLFSSCNLLAHITDIMFGNNPYSHKEFERRYSFLWSERKTNNIPHLPCMHRDCTRKSELTYILIICADGECTIGVCELHSHIMRYLCNAERHYCPGQAYNWIPTQSSLVFPKNWLKLPAGFVGERSDLTSVLHEGGEYDAYSLPYTCQYIDIRRSIDQVLAPGDVLRQHAEHTAEWMYSVRFCKQWFSSADLRQRAHDYATAYANLKTELKEEGISLYVDYDDEALPAQREWDYIAVKGSAQRQEAIIKQMLEIELKIKSWDDQCWQSIHAYSVRQPFSCYTALTNAFI